ncbi:Hsp70 family protein [Candidatus Magnetomoraceae bacterium gMMP-15]
MTQQRYIIGIDLGTTNSAVSYVDLADNTSLQPRIKIFKIPQLTAFGEVSRLSVLPSFLYLFESYDMDPESLSLPWDVDENQITGAFARDYGAKIPSRLVSSAKSWLCHDRIDRKAPVLPWGDGDHIKRVSPVEASASYLKHIRMAWNNRMQDDEDNYLENQMVIITVPASFDEIARDLTIEAAHLAGIPDITLLEEPLAAFYSWLIRHENDWNEFIQPGQLILVCDSGGGTTDFTLITLREVDGSPRFERIAVGDHLILGGDNIDLTLARKVERNFGSKSLGLLNINRWQALCHQCRQAKEDILDGKSKSKVITLVGEGSKIIGGTLSASIDFDEIKNTVLNGFFPILSPETKPDEKERKGITEFGLPYEQEPAITKHLCIFLERHIKDVQTVIGRENPRPDLILFNGGTLKSKIVQERIKSAICHWFNEDNPDLVEILTNPDPSLAVAQGASYYGLVKTGQGVRVGSGSARAYYLGVATSDGGDAVCIVERGLEEGSVVKLKDKSFEVLTNQPVNFDLYSSSFRAGDLAGDLVKIDGSLTPLPVLKTVIKYGKKAGQTVLPIQIEVDYTELGTLALWCCSAKTNHRWQLQFELRGRNINLQVANKEVFEESLIDEVRLKIQEVFSAEFSGNPEELVKIITNVVERPRKRWPLSFLRAVIDELFRLKSGRKISPSHESRWLNLTGYCLRPGFGDALDDHRIGNLWKLHKPGPVFNKNSQVRPEWWILWRRVAGGLSAGQQRQFAQELNSILKSKKKGPRISPQERIEIWMTLANMERLIIKDKIELGRILLDEIRPKKCKPQHWWALSRIGAREPLYGPIDRVISPQIIDEWIDIILSRIWRNLKPVGITLAQMARLTGDRKRDLEQNTLNRVIDWLNRHDVAESQIKCLKEVIPISRKEEDVIFGESLPSGIILSKPD